MNSTGPVVWTLHDAVSLVRLIQPALHGVGWHCALGGSVISKGWSSKDADLYVIPMSEKSTVEQGLAAIYGALPGQTQDMSGPWDYDFAGGLVGVAFQYQGKRVDCFFLDPTR